MPLAVQKEVVRSLKSEIFLGFGAILIAAPHHAFDAISVEREMEGRFAHVEIPTWDKEDLKKIGAKGFPALNIDVPEAILSEFANESFGSPLLMQRFCSRLCTDYDVIKTLASRRSFNPSRARRTEIYSSVAKQFGLTAFSRLSRGPQQRTDRLPRRLRNSEKAVDLYEAILIAVAKTGPKSEISYNEIRSALQEILQEAHMPQKNQITNALGHMHKIAKSKIEGEPVLEYVDDILYLVDPFLKFYMRWSLTHADDAVQFLD